MIADPKMFELPVQNSDVITEFCYVTETRGLS